MYKTVAITILVMMLGIPMIHVDVVDYYKFNHDDVTYDILIVDSLDDFPEDCGKDSSMCVFKINNEYGIHIVIFIYQSGKVMFSA